MKNDPIWAAAEGMPTFNRRSFITSCATVVAVVATPAVAKMIGVKDQPYRAQKFSGSGWYAFADDFNPASGLCGEYYIANNGKAALSFIASTICSLADLLKS